MEWPQIILLGGILFQIGAIVFVQISRRIRGEQEEQQLEEERN